jgi:hypothetical protein
VPYGPTDITQSATALCPTGQRAISGGGVNVGDEQLAASIPASPNREGWGVVGVDLTDNGGEYVQAYAVCAPAGQAVAASKGKARHDVAELEAKLRAQLR